MHRKAISKPCRLCGAPAGMTCGEYAYMQQVNAGFGMIEEAFEPIVEPVEDGRVAA